MIEDEPIPSWAIRKANQILAVGAQLPTRDGRRTGNAHIIAIENWNNTSGMTGRPVYVVLTDAGSVIRCVAEEVHELFHLPMWVSDVNEVMIRFGRDPEDV